MASKDDSGVSVLSAFALTLSHHEECLGIIMGRHKLAQFVLSWTYNRFLFKMTVD